MGSYLFLYVTGDGGLQFNYTLKQVIFLSWTNWHIYVNLKGPPYKIALLQPQQEVDKNRNLSCARQWFLMSVLFLPEYLAVKEITVQTKSPLRLAMVPESKVVPGLLGRKPHWLEGTIPCKLCFKSLSYILLKEKIWKDH